MHRHYLLIPLACLALTACLPAPQPRRIDNVAWSAVPPVTADDYELRDPASFGLSGQESLAEAGAIIQARLSPSEAPGGNYAEMVDIYSARIIGEDGGIVALTQDNLPDDSVLAVQHVVSFRVDRETDAAAPLAYGIRQKCRRGSDPGVWTAQPCP